MPVNGLALVAADTAQLSENAENPGGS